jgi:3-oxoacyl-[acyl-carrier-protein] synthase-1
MITPLGIGVSHNFEQVLSGKKAVSNHSRADIDADPIHAALIPDDRFPESGPTGFTRFERMLTTSISEACASSGTDPAARHTLFVISTTKGSISLLEEQEATPQTIERSSLWYSARKVATHFNNPTDPVIISHACISGITSLLYAKRMLETGRFSHAVVAGADAIGRFVYSGFRAFMALSPGYCKPFSESRDGINLGEAGAAVVLTTDPGKKGTGIALGAGSISNDANHISGPSRTGDELARAIGIALSGSGLTAADMGFISAHGTATPFNDEMEAKAFAVSGLNEIPVNSLKGYFGHTLGAAGLVESVISMEGMRNSTVVASAGYTGQCVHPDITVAGQPILKKMKHFLKTASGFGGCNAALVFSKMQ